MASSFAKLIVIYFCINAILFTGGVRVIGGDATDLLDDFINVNATANGSISVNAEFVDTMPTTLEKSGFFSQTLEFVDSIRAVKRVISLFINIMFAPLGLFTGAGLPADMVLIIGVPLMILLWIGGAYFIRSGS